MNTRNARKKPGDSRGSIMLERLSLWVRNLWFKLTHSKYDNRFVETSHFVAQELKDDDKFMILALFSEEELDKALIEKRFQKWYEDMTEHVEEYVNP
jgi:hypothetical protein